MWTMVKSDPLPSGGYPKWTDSSKKATARSSYAASFCDYFEKCIVWAFADTSEPNPYLSGNYAPVQETEPSADLPVSGSFPDCLNGEFVRVGANPKFSPVAGYHWFDGDGMIHGLQIRNGKVTYVSRFVKTSRLQQEEYYGGAKFMKFGDVRGIGGILFLCLQKLRVKLGVIDPSNGEGTGNTALVFHNKKLLALHEGDKPYAIRLLEDGDLETIGRMDYESRVDHPFTAHPKIDAFTGEMFFFGYRAEAPHLVYRIASKDGVMAEPVPITLSECVMMHDFAITENYAIFMDLPLVLRPKEILKGGYFFKFDPSRKSRFGVLPRYARNESQIRWFDIPTSFIFHNANAWEEGDEVILVTCRMPWMDLGIFQEENLENNKAALYEYRMNLKTGEVTQKQLGDLHVEFPKINDEYVGRKQQYVYTSVYDSTEKVIGVAKYDLSVEPELGNKQLKPGGNVKGLFLYGSGRYGSEAVFVPCTPGREGPEDDGYLIVFVYDENIGKSEVVVIDAKTMAPEPVAVARLPKSVPYGFHALFVTEEQLKNQG